MRMDSFSLIQKQIYDCDSVCNIAVLQVFGEQHVATGLLDGSEDHSVPETEALQVDCRQNVALVGDTEVHCAEDFDPLVGNGGIDLVFAGGFDEVLLKYLEA
jgi:hypothetical protein